ncbi:MAG: GLUG motif-containing protein [Eubacteriales bacterium]
MVKFRKKAVLAAICAVCLCSHALPALAAGETDDLASLFIEDTLLPVDPLFEAGTQENPYSVSSVQDLVTLAQIAASNTLEDVYFLQTADITVNADELFTESAGMLTVASGASPVVLPLIGANADKPFMGHYNGNGYRIRGLVTQSDAGCAGLFGTVKNAEIINVHVEHSVLNVGSYVGGLVGKCDGSTRIAGCSFDGTISVREKGSNLACRIGGIVGYVDTTAQVTDCVSTASVKVTDSPFVLYVGGIAGLNIGTVSECVNRGGLDVVSNYCTVSAGGIVGDNMGTVQGCVNDGDMSGGIAALVASLNLGGVTGVNSGTVERVRNRGAITAFGYDAYPAYAGGIVGNNGGLVRVCSNNGVIYADSSYVGGIAGINLASEGKTARVSNCLNTGLIIGDVGVIGGLIGANATGTGTGNTAVLEASLNLDDAWYGNPAIGAVEVSGANTGKVTDVYVRNGEDAYAVTLDDETLLTADALEGLDDEAWVYPQDGFFPGLAVVKNLEKSEAVDIAVDTYAGKVAFALYHSGRAQDAVAYLAFYEEGRLVQLVSQPVTLTEGYTVYTADAPGAKTADEIRIIVLDAAGRLSPVTSMARF